MEIGVSGTREGMTLFQQEMVIDFFKHCLLHNDKIGIHHGDCVGADSNFNEIATALKFRTTAWPPVSDRYRAFCKSDVIMPKQQYYPRNRSIVHNSDFLVAAPKSSVQKGGTWYTINYAKDKGMVVRVVWPAGKMERII